MNVSLEGHDPAVNIAVGQDQGRFAAQMEPFFQLSVWSAQHTEGGPGESRGILNNLERGDSLDRQTVESSVHNIWMGATPAAFCSTRSPSSSRSKTSIRGRTIALLTSRIDSS